MSRYDDIIALDRPTSQHKQMSKSERAAQFLPFAALSGYEALVNDTVRQKQKRPELSEEEIEQIDRKLRLLSLKDGKEKQVSVRYVLESLTGGEVSILSREGSVTRVDAERGILVLGGESAIFFGDILSIEDRQ